MKPFTQWLAGMVCLVALFTKAESLPTTGVSSTESPVPVSCGAPEYHQFDFWIGDWDVFEINGSTPVARVRVDRILDGCVLHEEYEDTNGLKGQSFGIYDASRKIWHQSWVTNRGQLLVIEGKIQAGEIVLDGVDHTQDDRERRVRAAWKPVDGGVRETAATSTDGGKTWKPWFDLVFRSHKP